MGSVPERHVEGLPGAARNDAYEKFEVVLTNRRYGIGTEEEIAEKAGFGGVEAMHQQLRRWGLSGLLPLENQEKSYSATAPRSSAERKGRRGGETAEQLPAAAGASNLFESAIARLNSDLHYTRHLSEVLQGGLFEAALVYPKEEAPHPFVYLRDEVSAERWEELCAEQGEDPAATDTLYAYTESRYLAGTSPWPTMHLVRLIAAYCLCVARTWHDIEVLLDHLHPAGREPNVEQVKKYLISDRGLLPTAKKLAQVVRGKPVERGRNTVGEDPHHHSIGDFIRISKEQGIPEEEIIRVLHEEYHLPGDEISRLEDVFSPRTTD